MPVDYFKEEMNADHLAIKQSLNDEYPSWYKCICICMCMYRYMFVFVVGIATGAKTRPLSRISFFKHFYRHIEKRKIEFE